MSSRSSKTKSIASQTAELAAAVPQVVAHRVTRMAFAGSAPSARDRKEFKLMVEEKNDAFAQSWQAMARQAMLANQALALSMFRAVWSPFSWGKPPSVKLVRQAQNAALGIVSKGIAPVHRKAVANAKRLAHTKLR